MTNITGLLWPIHTYKDLQKMGFTREETKVAAFDRPGWRRSVAQWVQLNGG